MSSLQPNCSKIFLLALNMDHEHVWEESTAKLQYNNKWKKNITQMAQNNFNLEIRTKYSSKI